MLLQRFLTLLLLSLQLMVLGVGAMPERESCCCVARGKACKCKSHAKKPPAGPCVSKKSPGCGTPNEVTFSPLTWVSLPEPEPVARLMPLQLEHEWEVVPFESLESSEVRAPPPRSAS
ncbi:MAG: hypothetical protein QM817_32535 [Archangium sp.]